MNAVRGSLTFVVLVGALLAGEICCSGGCGELCVNSDGLPSKRDDSCSSPRDCPASHCCVNRQPGATSGVCQKMGSMSAVCYVRDPYTATPPPGVVQTCPCGFGNYCSGRPGSIDEFGKKGLCRSFK
ncbi:uncharacterized protein LOC121372385 [Gigantopelta aegis]|uniref:uncharacterized protein LOC121372385 n=1 Tax=Gigantopelta aegis TaxID=1735272 RepID=UPI001B88A678|nr:uncharacterized protein LOC121372385 [Gigantopelta aegis]